MAVNSSNNPTLLDLASRQNPDGTIAQIAEILQETNEILADMSWVEGNRETGHTSTQRTSLPSPTFRKYYGGVQPSKSTTVQITDTCAMLEAYAEVDKALADLNGNTAAFRLSEDRAHIEGMNQTVAETIFFGNEATSPEQFTGLAPRFNDLSAENADNIVDAGGTGSDNASIWLIVWNPMWIHGIVPKGSTAGLQATDKGQVTIEDVDGNGGRMEAYRTHYRWDVGLAVRDWRYVVRIANIDKSLLTNVFTAGTFTAGADLLSLMEDACRLIPTMAGGRPAFYMSRDIASWVGKQKAAKGIVSGRTGNDGVAEKGWFDDFNGIPIRRVDALSADEAQVT